MTVLEMDAIKAELTQSILSIDNEDVLNRLLRYVKKLAVPQHPCMYSPEEIQAGAERFLQAYQSGDKNRFIPHEKMKKKHLP